MVAERTAESTPPESSEKPSPPMLVVGTPGSKNVVIVEQVETWKLVRAVLENKTGAIRTPQDIRKLASDENICDGEERLAEIVSGAMAVFRTAAVSDPGIEIFGDTEETQSVFIGEERTTQAIETNPAAVLAQMLGKATRRRNAPIEIKKGTPPSVNGAALPVRARRTTSGAIRTSSPTGGVNGQVESAARPVTAANVRKRRVPAATRKGLPFRERIPPPVEKYPLRVDQRIRVGVALLSRVVMTREEWTEPKSFQNFMSTTNIPTGSIEGWPAKEVQNLVLEGVLAEVFILWDLNRCPASGPSRQAWLLIKKCKKQGHRKARFITAVCADFHMSSSAQKLKNLFREATPPAPVPAKPAERVRDARPDRKPLVRRETVASGPAVPTATPVVVYQAPPGVAVETTAPAIQASVPTAPSATAGGLPFKEVARPAKTEERYLIREDELIRLGARIASAISGGKKRWEKNRSLEIMLTNMGGVEVKRIKNWPNEEAQSLILEGALVEIFKSWDLNTRPPAGESYRMWGIVQGLKKTDRTNTKENVIDRACEYFRLMFLAETIKRNLLTVAQPLLTYHA